MLVKHKLFKQMRIVVNASKLPIGFGTNLDFFSGFSSADTEPSLLEAEAPGLIAFTSGATGTPKGVIFTNKMLAAQLDIFESHFGVTGGQKDLPLLPIFSIYSTSAGVTSVFYPSDPGKPLELSPVQICKVVRDLSIETSFGSPTLWAKIASYALGQAITLPSLKRIFMAGTSVPSKVISQVGSVCPRAQIFTPYGATEALPVTLSPSSELSHQAENANNGMLGIPVGKPLPELAIKVIQLSLSPIASLDQAKELKALEIGELIVKGANVSSAYWNRPDSNLIGKIKDGNDIWHRIGDACYLGTDGQIYYCGRVAHSISLKGSDGQVEELFSEPVELIFNKHPKVKRSALIYLSSVGRAALAIEPQPAYFPDSKELELKFIGELKELAKQTHYTAKIEDFFFFHNFPVDARHNAKVFRDQLGVLADQGHFDSVSGGN